jgi:SAM-dependent methyltransferase
MSLVSRIFRRLRRQLIDTPRGLGHPVPAAAFDREYDSGHWDLLFSEEELPRNEALVRQVAALPRPHPVVLDIGCGSGRLAQLLAPLRPAHYLGLDLSPAGLSRARTLGLPECEFIEGDFETWRPPAGSSFDAVIFNESLGYARDPRATLLAFAPWVRPGGFLLVSLFQSGNHRALWQRLTQRLAVLQETVVRGQVWDIRAFSPAQR